MQLANSKSAQPFDNWQRCCWKLGKKTGTKGVFFFFSSSAMLSHDACEGRCRPPWLHLRVAPPAPTTWHLGDALQAAEAEATSVAMATPKKEQEFNYFFFSQSKATCLKKNRTFLFG